MCHDSCDYNKPCILIIDDDERFTQVICDIINDLNIYSAICVDSAEKAKEEFNRHRFSVIILDLILNGTTSVSMELSEYFRSLDDNVYIVIVTDHYAEVFNYRIMSVADDFILKPFDIDYFQSRLFLWNLKYNRRLSIKTYIDSKTEQYEKKLNEIKKMNRQISETLGKAIEGASHGEG